MRPQRWLRDNFFAGLAIVLPVVLSVFLFYWALTRITGGVLTLLKKHWPDLAAGIKDPQAEIPIRIVILVAMIIATLLIGWLARTLIGRHLIKLSDMILERIPLFNRIYVVLRQISQSVLSEKSEMFSEVVLVEFPRPGLRSLAFVTGRSRGEIQDRTQGEVYTLFVPTSPNPTSGYMIMATEDEFERLDMSVEEGMKMVISGGAVLPEAHKLRGRRARAVPAPEPPAEVAPPPDGRSDA
jgi:uncharacterized membrane protein